MILLVHPLSPPRAEVWKEATEKAAGQPTARRVTDAAIALVNRAGYCPLGSSTTPRRHEISEPLRHEIQDTISTALNDAWAKLQTHREMNLQLFRAGVRNWLQG